jgi:hypothetical protein
VTVERISEGKCKWCKGDAVIEVTVDQPEIYAKIKLCEECVGKINEVSGRSLSICPALAGEEVRLEKFSQKHPSVNLHISEVLKKMCSKCKVGEKDNCINWQPDA